VIGLITLASEFGLGPVQVEGGAAWTDADIKKVVRLQVFPAAQPAPQCMPMHS
jgi:hypothetical protein